MQAMTHNEVSGAWRMARILRVLRTARMARLVRLMPEQHDWHIFSVNLVSIFGQPGSSNIWAFMVPCAIIYFFTSSQADDLDQRDDSCLSIRVLYPDVAWQ